MTRVIQGDLILLKFLRIRILGKKRWIPRFSLSTSISQTYFGKTGVRFNLVSSLGVRLLALLLRPVSISDNPVQRPGANCLLLIAIFVFRLYVLFCFDKSIRFLLLVAAMASHIAVLAFASLLLHGAIGMCSFLLNHAELIERFLR
jgi:hypothetical protein